MYVFLPWLIGVVLLIFQADSKCTDQNINIEYLQAAEDLSQITLKQLNEIAVEIGVVVNHKNPVLPRLDGQNYISRSSEIQKCINIQGFCADAALTLVKNLIEFSKDLTRIQTVDTGQLFAAYYFFLFSFDCVVNTSLYSLNPNDKRSQDPIEEFQLLSTPARSPPIPSPISTELVNSSVEAGILQQNGLQSSEGQLQGQASGQGNAIGRADGQLSAFSGQMQNSPQQFQTFEVSLNTSAG